MDMSMGGMDMGTNLFQSTNMAFARDYWYIIVGVLGLMAASRAVNFYKSEKRLRRRAANSVEYPTRPNTKFLEVWATLTAVAREASYPQLYSPSRWLSWLTPPPAGRIIVLLIYWAVITYMSTSDAIVGDAYFWERIGFRNAWVTVMQVPLLYLLASKCSILGIITGTSYERLNWLHRWVARTIFVTATIHGWHFYTEWVLADFVELELEMMPMVKYGLGAWGVLLWSLISSLGPLRRMAYEVFVIQHILTAVVFLWLVYEHVPSYAQYNVWLAIAALCFDRFCRTILLLWQNVKVFPNKAKCQGGQRIGHQAQVRAIGECITIITIKDVHFKWRAGQHLYLWMPRIGLAEAHPYTIACAHQVPGTCICNSIQLVVRKHNGFSRRLHDFAANAQAAGKKEKLTAFVSGPYGVPPRWDIYETLVLISASTGASFTLPILESVLNTKKTNCTKRIDFLLTAKQGEEIDFYVTRLHEFIDRANSIGIELLVHIAVTQGVSPRANSQNGTDVQALGSLSPTSTGSIQGKMINEITTEQPQVDLEKSAASSPRKRLSNASADSHVHHASVRPDVEAFIRGPVEATGGETSVVAISPNYFLRTAFSIRPVVTRTRSLLCAGTAMGAHALDALAQKVEGLSLESIADKYPNCYPENNPFDLYRAHLANVLGEITGVDTKIIYPSLSWTLSLDKGDLTLAAPALRVKGKKPDELAKEWAEKVSSRAAIIAALTFFVKGAPIVQSVVPMVRAFGSEYGCNKFLGLKDPRDPSKGKKRMIVEFSSPNIAKPFHAGHLRSTIIGGFLANLYEGAGWDVIRINYLGDWGKQYGLLALAFDRYGDEEALQKDPINHLFQLYVRINKEMSDEKETIEKRKQDGEDVAELEANSLDEQARRYFKSMTDRDAAAVAQWRRFRDLSIARYRETYARLNIRFDEYSGESQVTEEAMDRIGKIMEEKGICKEDKGAMIVDFQELVPGKEGKRLEKPIVRKRDGTALYLTRDISELLNRYKKYNFDQMIYVVASAQDLHLKQLFKIIELLGHKDIADRCQHVNFGLVLGMSTRKGTVKFLDDILRDVADKMHETMKKNDDKYSQVANPEATADTLGISSVMVQDMTGKRINNYTFNMDAMTSFEGDTGPYLQYAHARVCSIKRRAGLSDEDLASADLSLLTEPHAVNIVRLLAQWPDTFLNVLKTQEPTTVLTYLFRMTHALSSSYDHLQVVGSERELMKARMALYDAAHIVLANGMRLLGLSPVER
ncbi:arginine--tRNA ligase [Diplogelasinospora grovesii]|uniref:arginine--tRNA ligase n=1 Tax=Diplogelasinospora grovesii TaxID=303347 RepID=A0AAN6NAI3_9PEZI|nr:arginine--tRNA ligase [Diplogelasinospora grovesii]